ncbi:HAD family hydrolase [Pontibacter oryzae]|uniref:Beta-phosphoglucomutase n=1 Tax=Pontibacter oryzae TaxID=2304593 RepID=A0A399SJG4_9BACT|nr:beta-phosphoglucomutase family hydrolase [Pontibacter oryzae]RIJ41895.1 beta-phosphoglucomutase family hydrolase [Pontibacter oryzae]
MPDPDLLQALTDKGIKALIFDLDGVVTQTARIHAQAWKRTFDAYLQAKGDQNGIKYNPLSIETDYRRYIDGIPRHDGVRNFLASRGISLPAGTPADKAGTETIAGLGNQKNVYFQEVIKQQGVEVYADTVAFIEHMREKGFLTAVISASKNCQVILAAAGIEDLFAVRVDGVVAEALGLKGKPAPDVFLEAARQLNVEPYSTAIFEDALSGVEAGKAGKFSLVVGINRSNVSEELLTHGADLVLHKFPKP